MLFLNLCKINPSCLRICFLRIDGVRVFISVCESNRSPNNLFLRQKIREWARVCVCESKPFWKRLTACSNKQDIRYGNQMCHVRKKRLSLYYAYCSGITRDLRVPRYGCCLRIVRGRIRPNRSRSAGMFSIFDQLRNYHYFVTWPLKINKLLAEVSAAYTR